MSKYTRDNLPPEVESLFAALNATKATRVIEASAQRAFDAPGAVMFGMGAPAVGREEEIRIPGPAGEMRAIVYAEHAEQREPLPVVLYMHGGGFVIMLPESSSRLCKEIAIGADAIVVNLEYRRAPEDPYPAPLDDCVAAFRWLRENAASIGGDPSRIAVSGESAGGNLAAATALRLLADGEAPPEAAVLTCAWLDLTMSSESMAAFGPDDPAIDTAALSYWRECYAKDLELWNQPMLSPLLAGLSLFPPTCVIAGGVDPFVAENKAFAESLQRAGRDAELHVFEGMPHVFMLFPTLAPLTDAMARASAFLHKRLHP